MQEPEVSVVIASFNYARFLPAAIDSALAQTYPRKEIIVVDDGSTDGSRELLAGYRDRVLVVLKENGGHASAINAGMARAKGAIVALLDADDVFLPRKLERVVREHREHPEAVLVYHRQRTIDAQGRARGLAWPRAVLTGDLGESVARAGGFWPRPTTSAMSFTRGFLDAILPMSEHRARGGATWPDAYAGDLAPFFGEVRGIPDTLGLYRVHGDNATARINAADRARQIVFERAELSQNLARLGKPHALGPLDRHLSWLEMTWMAAQGVSLRRVALAVLASPQLGAAEKLVALSRLAKSAAAPRAQISPVNPGCS